MRSLVIVSLSVLLFLPLAFADEPPLSNEQVVEMHELGLGDDVILAKISASECDFDTSLEAIKTLKEGGISNQVIAAMIDAMAVAASMPEETVDDASDSGIYLVTGDNEAEWIKLEPNVYSQTKTGGLFKTAITYGAAKAKTRAVLRGAQATLRLDTYEPEFMFYFAGGGQSLDASGVPFFFGASSPNEFALVRMEPGTKKKELDTRQLVIGKFSPWGAKGGVFEESAVPFEFEKVDDRAYRVTPTEPLEPGEYCFFYAGSAQYAGAAGGKVFDFGVD